VEHRSKPFQAFTRAIVFSEDCRFLAPASVHCFDTQDNCERLRG
jgi:hypothetical protein